MVVPVPEILFSPRNTLEELKASLNGSNALLIQLSAWLSFAAGLLLFLNWKVTLGQFLLIYVFLVFFLAALKLAKAMLVHFFAEALGGEGKVTRFMALSCYADLPLHFLLPLGLLFRGSSILFFIPAFLTVGAWIGSLGFKALQVNYGIPWQKAFVAGLAPSLLFVVPICAVMITLAGLFAGLSILISQILNHLSFLH